MTNRRRIKLLLICLTIGSAINIAVAWLLVSNSNAMSLDVGEPLTELHARDVWNRHAQRTGPQSALEGQQFRKFGIVEVFVFPIDPDGALDHGGSTDWIMEWQCGWPLVCFRTGADFLQPERQFKTAIRNPAPFQFAGVKLGERLPYGPMLGGLAINTIFYTGLVWMVIRGPWEARRRWRELRGRCGSCNEVNAIAPACSRCGFDLSHAWGKSRPI